jgi:hypothetical protein
MHNECSRRRHASNFIKKIFKINGKCTLTHKQHKMHEMNQQNIEEEEEEKAE